MIKNDGYCPDCARLLTLTMIQGDIQQYECMDCKTNYYKPFNCNAITKYYSEALVEIKKGY